MAPPELFDACPTNSTRVHSQPLDIRHEDNDLYPAKPSARSPDEFLGTNFRHEALPRVGSMDPCLPKSRELAGLESFQAAPLALGHRELSSP
mmetsp:Transcript_4867/g.9846  ORF Transcript_4867/g.9846 Transcript_4867/m.9846 type:complete len:92 (+) Transcript_4867:1029-1304(+)